MNYTTISRNHSLYHTSLDMYNRISDPNKQKYWGYSSTAMHKILSMLGYFTNRHLCFKDSVISRNDSIYGVLNNVEYYVNYTIDNTTPNENYDFLHVSIVDVRAQITDTFENRAPEWFTQHGYTELTGYSLALKLTPRHRVRVYVKEFDKSITNVNPEDAITCKPKSIVVLTANRPYADENDALLFRKIVALIPLFCNEEIDPDAASTTIFRDIVNYTDGTQYLDTVLTFLQSTPAFAEFEMQETLNVLSNLNVFHQEHVVRCLSEQNDIIKDLEERLSGALIRQRELQYEYAGISDVSLSADDLKLLIKKDVVKTPRIESGCLKYLCDAPCLSFDKEAAIKYYKRNLLPNYPTHYMTKLFKLAFIDEVIVIVFEDSITLNFNNITINGKTNHNQGTTCGLRNPHHYFYNCWGSYLPIIKNLIKGYSFMQLFLQIKAAVGSLNMLDYTVLGRFREQIEDHVYREQNYNDTQPCIIWKAETDSTKRHHILETLEKFEGAVTNETD